jgi:hypothetical protein
VIKQFNSASFPDASNPGSVEFVVGGTRVIVSGYYDDATLESVAQSIINQATASP